MSVPAKLEALHAVIAGTGGAVVAFSGGVDSTLVAAVAARSLGDRALAVTAISPSLPPGEAEEARRLASLIRVRHRTVRTEEFDRRGYLANGPDRCYQCKDELYGVLAQVAEREGLPVVVSGANLDDLGDVRPGLRAAAEHGVRHPLVEAGLGKQDVREAARSLGIPTWDKPASACLSSRIEHGVTITVEALSRVGRAEQLLRDLGFRQVRVRVHGETRDLARVEVDAAEVARLAEPTVRDLVVTGLKALGFRYVAVDLEGFRSGSMNPQPPETPDASGPSGGPDGPR